MKMRPWVKLPTQWIESHGLRQFRWAQQAGAQNTAALITLLVIAHHADADTGIARLRYDDIEEAASLSRSLVSAALDCLEAAKLIVREPEGRSTLALTAFNQTPWGQLPAKALYSHGRISAFADFKLRRPAELDALKLYLLIVSRRSTGLNMTILTYDAIESYSGIPRANIKRGLSLLSSHGLIYIEHLPRQAGEPGAVSGYRLVHIDSRNHMGTTGRGIDPLDFEALR